MPIQILTIVVLILIVFYLIYRLNRASKEKIVVLVLSQSGKTSWKIFDSMVEAKAYVKTESPTWSLCHIIRTTDVNKRIPKGN